MKNTIAQVFHWNGMEADIRTFADGCVTCLKAKHPTARYGLLPPKTIEVWPWYEIAVDSIGPYGKKGFRALTIIGTATRLVEILPALDATSAEAAYLMDRYWFTRYTRPARCIHDGESEFKMEFVELLDSYGVERVVTTTRNPQANAVIERIHRVISEKMRTKSIVTAEDWANFLNNTMFAMRASNHSMLKASPAQLAFGRDMLVNMAHKTNWAAEHKRKMDQVRAHNRRENQGRAEWSYRPGDYVIEELLQVKAAFNANSLPPAARKASLIGFWRQMRPIIAVNPASVGLKILDEIAEALINEDEEGAEAFFDGLITLLPDPARQQSGGVPVDHEVFTDTPNRSRSPSLTEQQGGVLVPKAASHAIKKFKVDFGLSSENKTTTASPTKKAEKLPVPKKKKTTPTRQSDKLLSDKKRKKKTTDSADQTSAEETAAEQTEALQTDEEEDPDAKGLREELTIVKKDLDEYVDFPVSEAADIAVKKAIAKLFKEAIGKGVDLVDDSSRCSSTNEAEAIIGRYDFTSLMIDTWGWYGTLHRMERTGHRNLYRNTPEKGWKAFLQRFRDVRSPGRLDRHGFSSLPTLLELTDALNPDDKPKKGPEYRLSDLALAFVLWDVTSTQQVPSHWSGDITKGVWLKLTQSERIRDRRIKIEREVAAGTYKPPIVTPYDEIKSKVEGITSFKNFDGSYTALPPLNKIAPWVDKRDEVITLSEDDEVEDGEVAEEDALTGVSTCSGRGHSFMRPSRADSAKSKSK
ncbi:Pol Polyprotein [Phytophthora megakarya]|uniref:Pol Polyprotein n=1 Tax=Phytophthora megakarya TaxID=4795 RepID=A0A225WVK9_9STRA|nr:Pol Polyprotein [Phytophthora megakarya]